MKPLISSVIASLSLVLAVGAAEAAWSNNGNGDQVTEIKQSRSSYDSGKTVIKLQNTTCPTGEFFIADSSSNKELQVKLLMSALLAGRDVVLGYQSTTGVGCDVYSVILR